MKLTIGESTYILPQSYKDISLKKFKEVQEFIDVHPISKFFLEDEGAYTEEELINYYIDFVSIACDIPKKLLMYLPTHEADGVTIQNIFTSLTWLFIMPDNTQPEPASKLIGYHFIDNSGLMRNNTLLEYTEANSIVKALNGVQRDYKYLNLLLAIFYRPKKGFFKRKIIDYDSEEVQSRSKEFDSVDMQTVFNCLFFFMKSKKDYLKNIEGYLAEELERAAKL